MATRLTRLLQPTGTRPTVVAAGAVWWRVPAAEQQPLDALECMGQQISFFRNATVEHRLLEEVARIGLGAFSLPPTEPIHVHMKNLTAFGFKAPTEPSAWTDDDFIEYGYFPQAFSARLWFDPLYLDGSPKPLEICAAYMQLVKYLKRGSTFDRESRIWVPTEFAPEFRQRDDEKKRELALLVERNRQFAVQHLGAKLRRPDDASN